VWKLSQEGGGGRGVELIVLSRWMANESLPRVVTEVPLIDFFSELAGVPNFDPLGSYVVMERGLAKTILEESISRQVLSFPVSKWVVIAKELGHNLGRVRAMGLGAYEIPEVVDFELLKVKAEEAAQIKEREGHHEAAWAYRYAGQRGDLDMLPVSRGLGIFRGEYRRVEQSKREWETRVATGTQILGFIGEEIAGGRLVLGNSELDELARTERHYDRLRNRLMSEGENISREFLQRAREWYSARFEGFVERGGGVELG